MLSQSVSLRNINSTTLVWCRKCRKTKKAINQMKNPCDHQKFTQKAEKEYHMCNGIIALLTMSVRDGYLRVYAGPARSAWFLSSCASMGALSSIFQMCSQNPDYHMPPCEGLRRASHSVCPFLSIKYAVAQQCGKIIFIMLYVRTCYRYRWRSAFARRWLTYGYPAM